MNKMVKISIICLIYKSSEFADWVYNSVEKFTPQLKSWEAEFIFIANNPTEKVVDHLKDKWYTYYINSNPEYSEKELFKSWYSKPSYMTKVYRGYNYWILKAKWERVVLINSDNYFSKDWLENLLKYSDRTKIVSSTLVERDHPVYWIFPWAVHWEFWENIKKFQENNFLAFSEKIKKTGLINWKAFMPSLLYRDVAIQGWLYPEWNIAGNSYNDIIEYWDENFFRRLSLMWVKHITSLDSISYHLKEWEKELWEKSKAYKWKEKYIKKELKSYYKYIKWSKIEEIIIPGKNHFFIINKLLWIKENLKWKILKYFNINKIKNIIYIILVKTKLIKIVKKILNKILNK